MQHCLTADSPKILTGEALGGGLPLPLGVGFIKQLSRQAWANWPN